MTDEAWRCPKCRALNEANRAWCRLCSHSPRDDELIEQFERGADELRDVLDAEREKAKGTPAGSK